MLMANGCDADASCSDQNVKLSVIESLKKEFGTGNNVEKMTDTLVLDTIRTIDKNSVTGSIMCAANVKYVEPTGIITLSVRFKVEKTDDGKHYVTVYNDGMIHKEWTK